ncbi:hypothetical protein [Streptomyces ipomoeae]|uniref:hypothetical protein n=1 Tax=Streptomyces ipomoeae TaxID=103232 RepID=UPI0029BE2E41|nr:hypothetical protein [Streptomyces ipomoeae]MDX2692182.1 hypothetical protein [Streptomyces ipomoeae]MDX2839289.1 hypothetical protein [Streptomyces ipomoeae]
MPTFLIVTGMLAATAMAWFYVGLMRVYSGRAKNVVEGMTPQRIVYRRLSRQIRREHGR